MVRRIALVLVAATVIAALFVFVPTSSAQAQCYPDQSKIIARDGASSDEFGQAVAVSGNTVVVGAHFDDDAGSFTGAAYVFVLNGASWVQQAKLVASDANAADDFGESVAIAGDTIVIGAPNDSDLVQHGGSAYVFQRTGDLWVQQTKLIASDTAAYDDFGRSVSIDRDTIVVGSYGDDTPIASDAGSALVFVRQGDAWVEQQKLFASDGEFGDNFGRAVSLNGDTAIIGALYDDTPAGPYAGSAYIFQRSNGAWSQQTKLLASDAVQNDFFGESVAVFGDYAIVGAPEADSPLIDLGAAYVFKRTNGAWSQQIKLTPENGSVFDGFGRSVAIYDDKAVVGDWAYDSPQPGAGTAFLFERAGDIWIERFALAASDASFGDYLGIAVSISNKTVVAGAYWADGAATKSGAAYIFDLDSGPDIIQQPQSIVVQPGQNAIFSIAISNPASASYQWRKGGIALSDGGNVSGSVTSTLTISNASSADFGAYDCLVAVPCGHNLSNPAALAVVEASTCPADIQPAPGDGVVNTADLLRLINSWGPCP